jgi:hypothetical protein
MLRFFRQIRQRLLTDNKFRKYLLYAVGEILLVVIGILIALQIDNWNEHQKEEQFEIKLLSELRSSLEHNVSQLQRGMRVNNEAIESCKVILQYFEDGLAYHDSLDTHFSKSLAWFYPSIKSDEYESLQSYGVHIIKNDTIRERLRRVYQIEWLTILSERQERYFYNTVAPLLSDLFQSYEFQGQMKPFDFKEVQASREYRHIIRTLVSNRESQNYYWKEFADSRERLITMISEEISKRQQEN